MIPTHWIPGRCEYSGGLFKAVCGAWVERRDHRSDPSCSHCQDWLDAEDVRTAKVLARISPDAPCGEDVQR